MADVSEKVDYAVSENTEILLDLGPADSMIYKVSDRIDDIVLTSDHAQQSLPKNIYACHICDKIFGDDNALVSHVDSTHKSSKIIFKINKETSPSNDKSKCKPDFCHKVTMTSDEETAMPDVIEETAVSKPYKCAHCGERFQRGSDVGAHMYKHCRQLVHKCHYCRKVFESRNVLDEHLSVKHFVQKENLAQRHRCGHCGYSFNHRNHLYKHIKSHKDSSLGSEDASVINIIVGSAPPQSGAKTGKSDQSQASSEQVEELPETFMKNECEYCKQRFADKNSVKRHVKCCHPESKCSLCGEHLMSKDKLEEHKNVHQQTNLNLNGKKINVILQSSNSTVKRVSIPNPNSTTAASDKELSSSLICPIPTPLPLTQTTGTNTDNSLTKLPIVRNQKASKYEQVKKTEVDGSNFKCDKCSIVFPTLKQLTKHMNESHCTAQQQKFNCEYCPKSFNKRLVYLKHLRSHFEKRNYCCNICFLAFDNAHQQQEHLHSCHLTNLPQCCRHCSQMFVKKVDLINHQKTVHPEAIVYRCEICSCEFVSGDDLSTHMKRHAMKSAYKCDLCSKVFMKVSSLFQHSAVHACKSLFKCQYCPKQYVSQLLLKKHLQIHKKKTSGITCKVCLKSFTKKSDFTKHLVTHLHRGRVPHTCCGKTFLKVFDLQKHLTLKHHLLP